MKNNNKYPYYIVPAIERMNSYTNSDEKLNLRKYITVNLGDEETLRELFHFDSEPLAGFYPDTVTSDPTTSETIDTFLNQYSEQSGRQIPIPPVLDTNLPKPHTPKRSIMHEPESPALTESFAKIMIKNGNYAKALEIITELNLKNTKKNIYFADQIRFLRKLIVNQQKN